MQRILILTQDPVTARTVEAIARIDGRVARAEASPEQCLIAVREWRPALLVVDLATGLTSGGLAAFLRDEAVQQIVAVLALATVPQLGLLGPHIRVDDFALAPLNEEELRTRIARLLWEQGDTEDATVIRHGSLVIDLERYKVTVDGEVVDLTYKEYELLRFLASNPGKPFTREALLNQVWGYDYYGGSRTVDVHVRRIRSKIEQREQFIDTVRNVGYRFVETFTSRR